MGGLAATPLLSAPARAGLPPLPAVKPPTPSFLRGEVRELAFEHLHTGETLKAAYWEGGRYVSDALAAVRHLMRDFRDGEEHDIDPLMLDILTQLKGRLGTESPFLVVSAYRSPETNALLAAQSANVAKKSYHLKGKAVDVRVDDRALRSLRDVALNLAAGGVGYYPNSNFVHIDSGPVRSW